MKRFTLGLVFFLGVIAFSGFVNAQTCADPDDVIFRISGNTNAHAEIASGNSLGYIDVCYSDIFGENHPDNPYTCVDNNGNGIPENRVLRLSGNTNAHAEDPLEDTLGYNYTCYGDLACAIKSSDDGTCEEAFGPNAKPVVNLTGTTNAHLDIAGQFTDEYTLCCSATGQLFESITDAHWEDSSGNRLTTDDLIYQGWTVYMVASTNLPNGGEVNFDIREINGGQSFQQADQYDTEQTAIVTGGKIRKPYTFNSDLTNDPTNEGLSGLSDCNQGGLEFRYVANQGSVISGPSSQINVLCRDQDTNPPPVAIIEAPEHRGIYFANTQINFTSASYDIDAPIKEFLWTVEHNGSVEFTDGNESFNHVFTTGGMRAVTLRVTDSADQTNESQIAIVILGESEMVSYINEPTHQEIIPARGNQPSINFEANDSFVVKSSGSGCSTTVECLAGYCPSSTKNAPNGCTGTKTVASAPASSSAADWSTITFEWIFREAGRVVHTIAATPGKVGGTFPFSRASNAFNDKRIDLTLKYNVGGADEAIESTSRVFTLGQCIQGGREAIQSDGTTLKTTEANNACKGPDAVAGNNDDCCIAGHECLDSGDGNYKCLPTTTTEDYNQCGDYITEDDCNDDDYRFADPNSAINDPSFDDLKCGQYENGVLNECACEWDEDEGDNGECKLVRTRNSIDNDCTYGSCAVRTLNADTAECVNGFIEYSVEAIYDSNGATCDITDDQAECVDRKTTVPCGRLNYELGFFDYIQFISALMVIFLIYLGLHYTNKKE